LEKDIDKIKTNRREHHHQRHLLIGRLRPHGPNKTTIEIVSTIQNCKNNVDRIGDVTSNDEKNQHQEKSWTFFYDPAGFG